MPSTFECAAKTIVKELSKNGELIPVESLKSSTHFNPYYLVRRKTKSSWFWRPQYVWLNLTLKDILDPSSPVPEVIQDGPFHFNDEVDGKVSGSVEVTASMQGRISGQTSNRTDLEVKILMVPLHTWDCLRKERTLKKPEPSIFQELRKRNEDIYVVTEAVKTQKEAVLKRSRNTEGFGKFTIPGASCFQGQGEGHLNTVKTVTVPEGSILAFQVAKLIIRNHWNVLLLPDKKQKTFPEERGGFTPCIESDVSTVNIATEFEELQDEVKEERSLLTMLDKKLRQCLLRDLLRLLQSEQDLLDLEGMLEKSLFSGVSLPKAEGMTGNILSNLQDRSGKLVEELAGAFLYLLGALSALSEIQYQILIQLLKTEEKILPQEVDLVREILKKNFNETKETTFSLPSELLSFAKDKREESTLIFVLLEECGLEISGNKSQFTWNPSALHSLCAVYGSLEMLQALSKGC
ncbi:gasdermin-D-like [Antechinus flavipes]|uniref:gasdermin-D-like n=1 Tax=Antechinus flavipes TaxID=38775 RepID=UPI0022364F1D|nr:gasdermin-D-like [Antechinus flavipes]XP_051827177.1 gasdermin-D-like [Antechinus flavipes]